MTVAYPVTSIYPVITDIDGQPLEGGYIWIGQSDLDPQTNPIQVYWDKELTIAAPQPIRTIGGYFARSGSPANVYAATDFSMRVMNKNGSIIYSAPRGSIAALEELAMTQLRADLASTVAGKGAALLGFNQIGTGAVARTAQDKMRETVSVKDFDGADPTGVTDSYAAFAAAIASLPSGGGKITVGPGIWKLATEPTWGTKSLHWDIDPSATFTGAGTGFGKFPYMETNPAQLAVGPFIQSHTSTKSAHPNGGVAAFQVEMLQPADYGAGQSVAIYAGAKGSSSDPAANVWAVNALIAVESTAAGVYQCIEVDVDTNSAAALVKGISISGGGAANPDVGIEITRLNGVWDRGLHILNAQDAIVVNPIVNGRGIVLGSPVGQVNTAISSIQFANNADTIFLQRATDTAPSGFLFRAVNAANNSNIILIDVLGNITTSGLMRATNFRTSSAALPAEANTLSIGSGISATAIAGTNGAVPAQVAAYLEVYHGANKYRIPLFN